MASFVALDFETADHGRDSACALGLVRVDGTDIVDEAYHLIRPPRRQFVFTHVHGLTWTDVRNEPTFAEIWPVVTPFLKGADFIAAHNASFDRGVLWACCAAAGLRAPRFRFVCTVQVARAAWGIRPTTLPNVCRCLKIDLRHHHAASDARACAGVALAAMRHGYPLP